jgi:hypothetical protein
MHKIEIYSINYNHVGLQKAPFGGISREFVCGLHDRIGDGIPDLTTYADMRAPYWIWKNRDDLDIIGFHGYRKFLDLRQPLVPEKPKWNDTPLKDFRAYQVWLTEYDGQGITELLAQYDMIVAPSFNCSYNIGMGIDFQRSRSPMDWEVFEDVMKEHGDFNFHTPHIRPMHFVTRAAVFKRYMDWWWPTAETMRPCIMSLDAHDSAYIARPMAYLSERMFSLWLDQSKLSVVEVPLLQCWEAK